MPCTDEKDARTAGGIQHGKGRGGTGLARVVALICGADSLRGHAFIKQQVHQMMRSEEGLALSPEEIFIDVADCLDWQMTEGIAVPKLPLVA